MNLLTGHFSGLNDPREEANLHDPLTNVPVIAASAAIADAKSYEDIVLYGTSTERVRRPGSPHCWT